MDSKYHLNEEQVKFFNENGYLVLRNWIPQDLLLHLQKAADLWIEEGFKKYDDNPHQREYAFVKNVYGKHLIRINTLIDKGNYECLEFLGSPYVAAVAESICGKNFVPAYDSFVMKQKADEQMISWHQDTVHSANYPVLVYGLYLDESTKESGALKIIPKTHKQEQDICDAGVKHGWDPPGVVQVEMEPGDLLLHEVMVVHGSQKIFADTMRRTIYFEFRSAEHVINEGPWDKQWIDIRNRIMPLAFERYKKSFPDKLQFKWNADSEFIPQDIDSDFGSELKKVTNFNFINTPGNYCVDNSKLMEELC